MPLNRFAIIATVHLSVYFLLLHYITPRWAPVICTGVALTIAFERHKLLLIALFNVLVGSITIADYRTTSGIWFGPALPWRGLLISAGAYFSVLAFFYCYLISTIKISRTWTIPPLILIVAAIGSRYFDLSPFFQSWIVLAIYGIWHNCFYMAQVGRFDEIRIIDFLACQRPFFFSELTPTPPLLSKLVGRVGRAEMLRSQRSGIQLLLATALCVWISRNSSALPESQYLFRRWPPGMPGGFDAQLSLTSPLSARWVIAVFSLLGIPLMIMIAMAPAIAACRMMGINSRAPIYDPFGAKTFSQFFGRFNHYYAVLTLDLFVYPIFRNLHFLKNQTVRISAAFFVGIFGVGVIHHYFRLLLFDRYYGSQSVWLRLAPASVYWAGIAFGVCLSLAFERKIIQSSNGPVSRILRCLFYALAYCLLVVFVKDYFIRGFSILDRARFALSLFGLYPNFLY